MWYTQGILASYRVTINFLRSFNKAENRICIVKRYTALKLLLKYSHLFVEFEENIFSCPYLENACAW